MIRRAIAAATLALACSSPAAAPAATTPATTPTATPTVAATQAAGSVAWNVASGSKAVVRVRETLAGFSAPNDAVLESTGVTGSFTLNPDGTFVQGSKIIVDLTALRSDEPNRDRFIKDSTLETRRFANAEFTPKRAVGLTLPLAAGGELTFKVEGAMKIRDVEKDWTFDVKATRTGNEVRATATNAPAFKFADFGMQIPRVASVLSIVDEIRLEVQLVAQQR